MLIFIASSPRSKDGPRAPLRRELFIGNQHGTGWHTKSNRPRPGSTTTLSPSFTLLCRTDHCFPLSRKPHTVTVSSNSVLANSLMLSATQRRHRLKNSPTSSSRKVRPHTSQVTCTKNTVHILRYYCAIIGPRVLCFGT